MNNEINPLIARIEQLEAEVRNLNHRVNEFEQGKQAAAAPVVPRTSKPADNEELLPSEAALLSGSSSLLMHISVISFLLVIALGLRALADNGIIDLQIGTLLGMAYATALIVAGYLFYRRNSTIAPILTTTGGLLMCSVLVETYTRFESIPMRVT